MHTAKGRVDADSRLQCNLLEAEVVVESHDDDFFLRRRQIVEQAADAFALLAVNHLVFARCFAQAEAVECFGLHLVFAHGAGSLAFAALVYDEVVCDACEPCAELSVRLVLMRTDGYDGTLECVLEEIVGNVAVFHQKEDIGINVRLMTSEEDVKSTVVTCFVQFDQLMVGHCR